MIYLDNAATGGFKPGAVIEEAGTVIKYLSANPGRSGHRLSVTGAETVFRCRGLLAELFNGTPDRVAFTKNCTEALNLAIFGTVKSGGHVITTVFEHNSVLRPLTHLKERGVIELDVVSPDDSTDICQVIESRIKPNTYMIVTTAVSNVTGLSLPVRKIGQTAKRHGVLYLVDGAQAGGHIPLDLKADNVDMLAVAGHKGLYGIMGSGALIFDENIQIAPLLFGGTGSMSHSLLQPQSYPESLEAGTLNLPAIAALCEGVRLVKHNLTNFSSHLQTYTQRAISGLTSCYGVTCYSLPNPSGIVAFRINGLSSDYVADKLNYDYDVAVRGGLHCAPLMHEFLGTEKDGLVRASFAVQNTTREIDYLVKSVKAISENQ